VSQKQYEPGQEAEEILATIQHVDAAWTDADIESATSMIQWSLAGRFYAFNPRGILKDRRYLLSAVAHMQGELADLRQYHDRASPQVQRLSEEVAAREAAEAREQQLKTAITTALAQLVGEWPMRARKTLREALAQASAQVEQKPVCDEFGGLERCCTYPNCYCGRKD
jgi:hypothetical protein